jgi:hypothetical protein
MATPTSNGTIYTLTNTQRRTGTNYIDSLLWGTKWGSSLGTAANLTYSFAQNSSFFKNNYDQGFPSNGFAALSSTQQTAAINALNAWSEVANLNLTQVTETRYNLNPPVTIVGDIRFAI